MAFEIVPRLIAYVWDAHTHHARTAAAAVRFFDGATPQAMHPVQCALEIMAEPKLDLVIRELGAEVLLLHDVREDTTQPIPDWADQQVTKVLRSMTFASREEEMQEIWRRPPFTRLLKLYDKLGNYRNVRSRAEQPRNQAYDEYVLRLARDIELEFGPLNVVKMIRMLVLIVD